MKTVSAATGDRHDFVLWWGVIGSPAIWLGQFEASYALASWACAHHQRWLIPAVGLFAAAVIGATAVIAWRRLRSFSQPVESDGGVRSIRVHFMALLGFCLSVLLFLVTSAQLLGLLFFPPCAE